MKDPELLKGVGGAISSGDVGGEGAFLPRGFLGLKARMCLRALSVAVLRTAA
jgi:hypothetical protein